MSNHTRTALERALVEALMRSLQPAIGNVVAAFRREIDAVLSSLSSGELQRAPAGQRQMGRQKSCSVCRLKGTRNDAALPSSHSQEDHRRWKAAWPASAGRRRGNRDAA